MVRRYFTVWVLIRHSDALYLKPETSHLKPETSHLKPETSHLKPETSHLKPETSHLKPETSHLKPETSHLKPCLMSQTPGVTPRWRGRAGEQRWRHIRRLAPRGTGEMQG